MNFINEIKKEAKPELVPLKDLSVGSIFSSDELQYKQYQMYRNDTLGKYERCPRKIRRILSRKEYHSGEFSGSSSQIINDRVSSGYKYKITSRTSAGTVTAIRVDGAETISIAKGVVESVRHWG